MEFIEIEGAREHNLQHISLRIPRNALVVITGVSGSGKSSLAFDTLFREGQYRYLSSLSSYARHFVGKMGASRVDRLKGLSPSLCMDQKTVVRNPRSTVGTLTDINSFLRLMFARLGEGAKGRSSSCFSFNSPSGACPICKGLGVEDRIDPDLLVADHSLSIRQGALKITTPTGYLMYSQVTLDVLNQVCQSHGFHVDIPWCDLTDEQKGIILNGSQRIKIPFGKHPLENRLKWSGITAKPREEGYYKGILPVMADILRRDRNKNILKFARSVTCQGCHGSRLNPDSLKVTLNQHNIAQVQDLSIGDLEFFLKGIPFDNKGQVIAQQLLEEIYSRLNLMKRLGLSYLTLNRESTHLNGGEAQRLRLVQQGANQLQGVLWVLDEPSIGLHPSDRDAMLCVLRDLRDLGNTVVIVEHDEESMRQADWIVDIGPKAGIEGGQVLFSGPPEELLKGDFPDSRTGQFLKRKTIITPPKKRRVGVGDMTLSGANLNNLKNPDATFKIGCLNVVTGPSGAGKSSLVYGVLVPTLQACLNGKQSDLSLATIQGCDSISHLIEVDQSAIGKNPRSNPATYTKIFDDIRSLFAKTETAKARSLGARHFSFNTKGGRCETCEGTGTQKLGMHFLPDTFTICETCLGKRFKDEVLDVTYKGINIYDVLELTVEEARILFSKVPKLVHPLQVLCDVGLGYLKLGQPSSTLSGGEAQRIKLAAHLSKPAAKGGKGKCLYLFSEPTTGLHSADIAVLLNVFSKLLDRGDTIVVIEHNLDLIKSADWVLDLGPGSGADGGNIVVEGTPEQVAANANSRLAPFLTQAINDPLREPVFRTSTVLVKPQPTCLSGVQTHNLKNLDVVVKNPSFTVITGVSGSGKSSLAFDTLYAESRRVFFQSLSTHARRYLKQLPRPDIERVSGLCPSIAIGQNQNPDHPRSLVTTASGLDPLLRLLFARFSKGHPEKGSLISSLFSFNHHLGACPACHGLGSRLSCDPEKLVTHPEKSLFEGAMKGTKQGRFFGDPDDQYLAVLKQVGLELGMEFNQPWDQLTPEAKDLAMHGTGDRIWKASWAFNRKGRKGTHNLETTWPGFCGHVTREYVRVQADHRGQAFLPVMTHYACAECQGTRLNKGVHEALFATKNLPTMMEWSISSCLAFFSNLNAQQAEITQEQFLAGTNLFREIRTLLENLDGMGLGYLSLNRAVNTLSMGERQRLRLAGALNGEMSGITYILDEPSRGLHPRDRQKLLQKLIQLRDQGNTLVVVEHDENFIKMADDIIDLGPASGERGGQIVFQGRFQELVASPTSATGKGLKSISEGISLKPEQPLNEGLTLTHARSHNLKIPSLTLPAGGLICVTGVSGSGKSSLLFDVIEASYLQAKPVHCDAIKGFDRFSGVFSMSQKPLGASPQSNPLSYTKLFDSFKKWFSGQEQAKQAGLKATCFSPFSKHGRCEACLGLGQQKIEMGFLSDVWVPCDICQGKQFKSDILEVEYKGRNIYDLLQLTIREAHSVLENCPGLKAGLALMEDLGIGHLKLGQGIHTLSGGEAQRLKLSKVLLESQTEDRGSLFLFDEPTNGLHFQDIQRLLGTFKRLTQRGHTLLVIEHNLKLISASDWVIDLGPEGGPGGGNVMFSGEPWKLKDQKDSHTGSCLKT